MHLTGWVEWEGHRLTEEELSSLLAADPGSISSCGGEFYLRWRYCQARDHFGIIPGPIPPGTLLCEGEFPRSICPHPPLTGLEEAICTAIELRADEGVVALSGGLDSTLIAAIGRRPAIVVGTKGAHDLDRAVRVAGILSLSLEVVEISARDLEEALPQVIAVIPETSPTNVAIAATLYFVTRRAASLGYQRILSGQGADELFGGYARYLTSRSLEHDLTRDLSELPAQLARDRAIAALYGTYFSLPYLDLRVVNAAFALPAAAKVVNRVRKVPLREVAARYLPPEIAGYEKKAMQYGSGVSRMIQKLARQHGHAKVGDYLRSLTD
jgi:asparagine synthase (glutamine-hydrolysing)